MRVLIVGGTRYLGLAIVRELLEHQYEVHVFNRGKTPASLPPEVICHKGNVGDREDLAVCVREGEFDAVIDTILSAQDLARHLPVISECCGQLVHCGSTGVYAPAEFLPSRETDPTPCPPELGGFGAKLEQDQTLLHFFADTGFKVCSLRISNVIGPGDVPLDVWGGRNPMCFQRLIDGKEIWIPNDGRALVQPVDVRDLARGFRLALETDRAGGQIYNLSSSRAVTLYQYARFAAEILNSRSEIQCVPAKQILATGRANAAGLWFLCEHMCIDSSKAAQDLGYQPKRGIRRSLKATIEWMFAKGLLEART